mgnify:CR=1 FL=1
MRKQNHIFPRPWPGSVTADELSTNAFVCRDPERGPGEAVWEG